MSESKGASSTGGGAYSTSDSSLALALVPSVATAVIISVKVEAEGTLSVLDCCLGTDASKSWPLPAAGVFGCGCDLLTLSNSATICLTDTSRPFRSTLVDLLPSGARF